MQVKNALISGFVLGALTGLLFLITGWIPLFGMFINALLLVCMLLFAFFGGFGVAYLNKRNADEAPTSCAASGALFGLIFSVAAVISAFLAFLIRSLISNAFTLVLSGGLTLPLVVFDLLANGAMVALCGLFSIAVIIALGAAGGFVGALVLKGKKQAA